MCAKACKNIEQFNAGYTFGNSQKELGELVELCAFSCLRKASCLKPFSDSNFGVKNYLFL